MNKPQLRDTPVDLTPAYIPLAIVSQLTSCITGCHEMRKGKLIGSVSGSTCMSCQHFAGLTATGNETGHVSKDHRGACQFPTPRRATSVERGEETFRVIHCPEAPVKVEGAPRGKLIKTKHCEGCEHNVGQTDTPSGGLLIHCTARKGVRYERTYLED